MKDVNLFFHVCSISRYKEIFNEIMIKAVPLINISKKIYISVVGPGRMENIIPKNNKIELIHFSDNIEDYEFPTLHLIQKVCKENDCYVCYFHTSGVSHPPEKLPTEDRRRYMIHFNIERYKDCITLLDYGFDAVGVDLDTEPANHFSGNFWWAKSEHINSLVSPEDLPPITNFYNKYDKKHRHRCEMWVCSRKEGYYFGMWHSQIPPSYRGVSFYPKSLYEYKKIWDINENGELYIKNDL